MPPALGFHGGGFVVGSRSELPFKELEYLTEHGILVVSADYRLCPQVSLFEGPIKDAHDIYAWCKGTLPHKMLRIGAIVDPSRIVAFGQSAGGLLALHLVRIKISISLSNANWSLRVADRIRLGPSWTSTAQNI